MRTRPAHVRRARPTAAAAVAAVLLAACSGGGGDDALTGAGPVDDVPIDEDAPTDAEPLPDVPGVTGAEPSDDVATEDPDGGATADAQVPPLLDVVDGWPETTVTLDDDTTILAKVAAESDRRQQGLMNVEELPEGIGMLFLFEEARSGGFWMKNTLVPLDIAYILDGEVVAVLQMEPCEADPCPSYDPETEYDAALEVNEGALAEAGVTEGSTVTWTEPVEVSAA